jgi:hypothetical protein
MGPRDSINEKRSAKSHCDESKDNDDDVTVQSVSHVFINVAENETVAFVDDQYARISSTYGHHGSNLRKSRRGWIRTITVVLCCMGLCVVLRLRAFSNDRAADMDGAFGSLYGVLVHAAIVDREMLVDGEEVIGEAERRKNMQRAHKKKRQMQMKNTDKNTGRKGNTNNDNRGTSRQKLPSAWNVDGPPVLLPKGVTLKSRAESRKSTTVSRRGPGEGKLQEPAQQQRQAGHTADDNGLPSALKTSGTPLHASEALQCRESVINFVINATDGKDECDGLIKAFDKTCSNDVDGVANRRRLTDHRQKQRRRTRRMWDKLNTPFAVRFRVLIYRSLQMIQEHVRYAVFFMGWYRDRDFFFAEDEVFKSWSNAEYLVDNGLEELAQCDARRFMHDSQIALHERETRRLQEGIYDSDGIEPTTVLQPQLPQGDKPKSTASISALQLPIKSQQHVTEKVASEAFFLQQSDKIINALNESAVAKEEAAKSVKSISDTTDVVSAVLNDPTSVEARKCCSSILEVFHTLCNTDDEEQVSDTRLFFLVFVMACCGIVKSLIRYFRILWLPEAAGCILVGGTFQTSRV